MTDKFYLKEVCGEYKFYEEGDDFPLTEKQILNKLNENEQLKKQNDNLIKMSAWIQVKNDKLSEENEKLKQAL